MWIDEVTICQWGAVLGASLAGAVCDVRTGRMPNGLTLPLAGAGLICAAWLDGLAGLAEGVVAWVVLASPYILLFVLGQGGAGDAKMMGAIGTWLGLRSGLTVLCCVALAGGVLALLKVAVIRDRGVVFRNVIASVYIWLIAFAGGRKGWALLKADPGQSVSQGVPQAMVPYGIAIFLGVCVGATVVHLWTG
jgi:Flp pilus assembly protein protease CpaA